MKQLVVAVVVRVLAVVEAVGPTWIEFVGPFELVLIFGHQALQQHYLHSSYSWGHLQQAMDEASEDYIAILDRHFGAWEQWQQMYEEEEARAEQQ